VSDLPFGFSMSNDPDDSSGRGSDNSGSGAGRGGSGGDFPNMPPGGFPFGDPQQIAQMLRQFADMVSAAQPVSGTGQGAGAGGVNWTAATTIARHVVSQHDDPSIGPVHYAQVQEALRLADLWLNEATALPSGLHTMEAWSRAEWVEKTMPTWAKLCDPLTGRVVEAMGRNVPQEMAAMAGPLIGMLQQMGGALVGQQAGQAIGELAREVVGSTDVGLPLAGEGRAALLPEGVKEFGEGLNIPLDEVRLYLAAREAAHHRLFRHVPWLRSHLFALVEEYAAGMSFDVSGFEERLGHIDITNPESLQEALAGLENQGLFQTEETPRQKASLARLETALALIEGWVSTVVEAAVSQRLPQSAALGEALRRRRASGGPAEHTFAALVGLELRPRRLRDAAALWNALTEARGIDGRDAVWEHPDLMPSSADLDSPDAFVRGSDSSGDLDLSQLTEDPPSGEGREEDGEDGR